MFTDTGYPAHPVVVFELGPARAVAWLNHDHQIEVRGNDPTFVRLVEQALKQPLWMSETTVEPDGGRTHRRVMLEPSDPRYLCTAFSVVGGLGLPAGTDARMGDKSELAEEAIHAAG